MNKVAILTTHRANNFGAVLQAFSLVKKCRELGADAEILDWITPIFERQYRSPWCHMSRNPLPGIRFAWRYLVHERMARRLFSEFRGRLHMSPRITSRELLRNVEKRYDSFIVGSDQVWNPRLTAYDPRRFDRTYLLDFVIHGRKNAYAASIGMESIQPVDLIPEYKRDLESFNNITMREIAGARFVSNILGRNVEVVLDPVMLHDVEFWRKCESSISTPKQSYVLVYNVQHYRKESQWMIDKAYEYANAKGFRVVDVFVPGACSKWTKDSVEAGPAEFLHLIDNAQVVFTNSFHASAFSIIFGKAMFLHISDMATTTNSRLDTLFTITRHQMREVSSNGDREKIFLCECNKNDEREIRRLIIHSTTLLMDMI